MSATVQEQEDKLFEEEQRMDNNENKEPNIKATDFKRHNSLGEVFEIAKNYAQREEISVSKYFDDIKDKATKFMLTGKYYNPDHPAGSITIDVKASPAILYKTDKDLQFARKTSMAEVLNPVAHLKGGNANRVELFLVPDPSKIEFKTKAKTKPGEEERWRTVGRNDYESLAKTINKELHKKKEAEPNKAKEIDALINATTQKLNMIENSNVFSQKKKEELKNSVYEKFARKGTVIMLREPHPDKDMLDSKGERAEIVNQTGKIGRKFTADMGYSFGMSVNGKVISLNEEEIKELEKTSKETGEKLDVLKESAMLNKFRLATAEVDRVGKEHAPTRKEALIESATKEGGRIVKWRVTMSATQGVMNGVGKALTNEKRNDAAMRSTLAHLFSQIIHSLGAGTRGLSR